MKSALVRAACPAMSVVLLNVAFGCEGSRIQLRLGESRGDVLSRIRHAYPSAKLERVLAGHNARGDFKRFEILSLIPEGGRTFKGWRLLLAFSEEGKVEELARIEEVERAALLKYCCLVPPEEVGSDRVIEWITKGQPYPDTAPLARVGESGYMMKYVPGGEPPRPLDLQWSSPGFRTPHHPLQRFFLWAQDEQNRVREMFFLDLNARAATVSDARVELEHQ